MDLRYDVFLVVRKVFLAMLTMDSTTKVGHKRIFLFTNEDNPNAGNQQLRERSFQRAKDLVELNIDIELFSMTKPGKTFDPMLFYQVYIQYNSLLTQL
jgi:hypothetical protein